MLQGAGAGFGALALNAMLARESFAASKVAPSVARAKRVIFLFMHGGPSTVDMFDPKPMLQREVDGKTAFRLLGVGISNLSELDADGEIGGLDLRADAHAKVELAMDKLRNKFGTDAVEKGRGLKGNGR